MNSILLTSVLGASHYRVHIHFRQIHKSELNFELYRLLKLFKMYTFLIVAQMRHRHGVANEILPFVMSMVTGHSSCSRHWRKNSK